MEITENKIQSEEQKKSITEQGNPAKPTGEAGRSMLQRMNDSHYEMTGWAIDQMEFREEDHVLDVGCGGGETLHRISGKLPVGMLKGIDYSMVSVSLSREINREDIESGKMDILEASVESLPFSDGTFDKVVSVESFYFWPDPRKGLAEIYRVLKPGGTFMLVAEIYDSDRLTEEQKENIRKYNMNNPSIREYMDLFQETGFTRTTVHTRDDKTWIAVEGDK